MSFPFCLQVNGVDQGVAYRVNKTQLGGQALYPHILTKNQDFSVNFGQMDKPMYPLLKGDPTHLLLSGFEMTILLFRFYPDRAAGHC